MSKGIRYKKLLEDLVPLDFYNLLRKGLQPYNEDSGEPIPCPQTLHKYFEITSKLRRLDNKIKSFTYDPSELKEAENILSRNGFIMVPENSSMIDRLDFLTNKKVITDEYFDQLRQKDGKYRITIKEIVILKDYRSKLIEKQNKLINQRSKIYDDDPELISWKNLVEITSKEQKMEFSEILKETFFVKDELDKLESSGQGKSRKKKQKTRGKTAYIILIENIIKGLMESNESIPKTKEVIQVIKTEKSEYDPEMVFQEYVKKEKKFYFCNPKNRKEYRPVKLKTLQNRIAEILAEYK